MRSGITAILVVGASSLLCINACRGGDCELTATCGVATSNDAAPSPLAEGGVSLDGGEDGGIYPPVDPPNGCDPGSDPRSAPACIDDTYALFVDAETGDDTLNPGTRAKPLKTIGAATRVDVLRGRGRIYVTSAPQVGSFVLPPGVTLVGGADRPDFLPATGKATIVNTGVAGALVRVSSSTRAVQITDFDLTPGQGVNAGASSIGLEIISAAVTLRRVAIHAQDGARGRLTPTPNNKRVETGTGQPGTSGHAAPAVKCTCTVKGSTVGGAGGEPNKPGGDGTADPAVVPSGPKTSRGGAASCGEGTAGIDGLAGPGGVAAPTVGRMTTSGWEPGNGGDGATGGPGAGGGGGGGNASEGGGSGGCGGCGGAGGFGGGAGGSSIGIASFESTLTLADCTIETKTAGDAEVGGDGQQGEGGAAGSTTSTCKGGAGGIGAGGSGGAGGAGGISVPIVRLGGSVTKVGVVKLVPGTHGKAGGGGKAGPAATSSSGAQGTFGYGGTALTASTEQLDL